MRNARDYRSWLTRGCLLACVALGIASCGNDDQSGVSTADSESSPSIEELEAEAFAPLEDLAESAGVSSGMAECAFQRLNGAIDDELKLDPADPLPDPAELEERVQQSAEPIAEALAAACSKGDPSSAPQLEDLIVQMLGPGVFSESTE